jgi:drug/metabolite transporter (DMT)-like permease
MNKNTIIAILMGLGTCVIWAGSFVIARGVHNWIPPVSLAFWRWVVAFVTLAPFTIRLVFQQWQLIKNQWKFITIMGLFSVTAFNTLVYTAAHYTTSHHISLISSAAPIGTLLIAGIIGFEAFTKSKILGAASAFLGVLIIISAGDLLTLFTQTWNKGDILLVFSMLIWASWGAALHYKAKELSSKVFLLSQIFVGVITLAPFYVWENLHLQNLGQPTAPFTLNAWIVYLYLGIGSSCIAWLAWQDCVRRIGAVKTSIIYYSLPIFSAILAVFTLHEPLEEYHFIGFIFIVAGIVIPNFEKEKAEVTKQVE